ncbi:MAG: hypoxanthine phosphoribosyltransferase [Lentisphaeria bacterium]
MNTDRVLIHGESYRLAFSEEQIQSRVRELGAELARAYAGRSPVFVGVLNGAVFFLADLVRQFPGPCEVDFVKISSYGAGKVSSGQVKELLPVSTDLRGRHVVVVEDIIDSGRSLEFLLARLSTHAPATVKVVAFLQKPLAGRTENGADYLGFTAPPGFLVGYGLDCNGAGRNLRAIYAQENPTPTPAEAATEAAPPE